MWQIILIAVSFVWIGFFLWARMDYRKRTGEEDKRKDKPSCRCEEDLEEYGKPLKDEEYPPSVDLDDTR